MDGRLCTCCASEDVDLLNGFLSTGYAECSIVGVGSGGAASVDLELLKALRSEAKEDFLENGELLVVVASEEWEVWTKGLNLRGANWVE